MSELRVDKIQPAADVISFTGITTFSSTGSFTIPGGTESQRPSSPVAGQVRVVSGEIGYAMEYYNGTSWVTV
jgi:hypothetical protein